MCVSQLRDFSSATLQAEYLRDRLGASSRFAPALCGLFGQAIEKQVAQQVLSSPLLAWRSEFGSRRVQPPNKYFMYLFPISMKARARKLTSVDASGRAVVIRNPMRDTNIGILRAYTGGGGDTCDHGLFRSSCECKRCCESSWRVDVTIAIRTTGKHVPDIYLVCVYWQIPGRSLHRNMPPLKMPRVLCMLWAAYNFTIECGIGIMIEDARVL